MPNLTDIPTVKPQPIAAKHKGRPPKREALRSRSLSALRHRAAKVVMQEWWLNGHRDILDMMLHVGVMTVDQVARLFYRERNDPTREAQEDVRRLFRAHLVDYTADVTGVLGDLGLPHSKALCLGRVGNVLVTSQHNAPERSRRMWSLMRPEYLAHNLMLAELVVRVQTHYMGIGFAGEAAATLSEKKKVVSGDPRKRGKTAFRFLLRPDGFFRWPGGAMCLIEVERSRRYDFGRIREKVERYNSVMEHRRDLWTGRWAVAKFPPVLLLALDPERHEARMRKEIADNQIGFLFRTWSDFLQDDDPLAGWRFWRTGAEIDIGERMQAQTKGN
jgi:hypothetical protein